METGKNLLSSSPPVPPKPHLRACPPSVLMLHEQVVSATTSAPTGIVRHFPASILFQEQRDEYRSPMNIWKGEKTLQESLNKGHIEMEVSNLKEHRTTDSEKYLKEFGQQLVKWPCLWNLLPSLWPGTDASLSLIVQSPSINSKNVKDVDSQDLIDLAKRALSTSKEPASLVQDDTLLGGDVDESISASLGPTSLADSAVEKKKTVRSTRLLDRQSKKRKVSKLKVVDPKTSSSRKADLQTKLNEEYDQNDPLRLFLWGPETKQLLTFEEESELIVQIQGLMRLEEVKSRLQSQFHREPTVVEWAEASGLSCRVLQSQLSSGNSSRERLINANLRMVVHIAKQYQGRGLSLQDLLQEGSRGLMKSVEKFKPQAGCRFATYAYWWIRHAIRKAIFQNSRTIRLPENVYGLLSKVVKAKRSCIQQGHHNPTDEQIAARVGITVEKLQILLLYTRTPLSMQHPIWLDQTTTYQEVTADTEVETPDMSVAKQLMRCHVRSLLNVLTPKEKQIIRQRYGMSDGKPKSLSEIGTNLGLSKERIRQLENRSLCKLKQCLGSHGLGAYVDLLV